MMIKIARYNKILEKDVVEHLQREGLELIGNYIDSNTKITFKCYNGHIDNVLYVDFKRRKNRGCNKCKNEYTVIWDGRIGNKYRDLILLSYEGKGMCKFICSCGEDTIKRFSDVERGKVTSCGHNKENQKMEDLTGRVFNKLTAIRNLGYREGQVYYLFQCDCGNKVERLAKEVKRGKLMSCGCTLMYAAGIANTTHGMTNTRLYGIWDKMKRRCNNESNTAYKYYGGRGISVCESWTKNFMNFYNWAISNGYDENLSIDRIDVNGNYEPSNCRWADSLTQANNKTNNIYFEYKGEKLTIPQWSRKLNLKQDALWRRVNIYGFSFEDAVTRDIYKISK